MAINLVSSIMQSLSPEIVAKIASMLGVNPTLAQQAIGVAVPALLRSFAGVASNPDGADRLSTALSRQAGALDQLKQTASGSDQRSFIDRGLQMLAGLLGRNGVNTLASAISTNAGIDASAGTSLLGMLGPVVAGVLGQQQKASGFDANGLASLLTSQKGAITAAMPQGMASQLGGLFESFDGQRRDRAATVSTAADRFGGMTEDTVAGASQAARVTADRSSSSLPYWLAGIAALLLALGGFYLLRENTRVAEQPTKSSTVGAAPTNVTAAELTNQFSSLVGTLKTDLQTITDQPSAQAAMPKLQQANDQLDRIDQLASRLPLAAQNELAAQVSTALPALNEICDRILAIPGVATVAKPTIDALRAKLDAIKRT